MHRSQLATTVLERLNSVSQLDYNHDFLFADGHPHHRHETILANMSKASARSALMYCGSQSKIVEHCDCTLNGLPHGSDI